ncbi:hypothetical protein CALVIDRAFT_562153 [Calocera viscosa TUFC12733]|uniref:Uncharacterized protein n=1 Tax=Calocera viscosa (strain TUFC12733) TaxID=1330018 RepID=A0A167NYD5_CALVF|nr:hypothetical protein CALVIDRAFT_562153 [Calocera viscosa TUFC12733]
MRKGRDAEKDNKDEDGFGSQEEMRMDTAEDFDPDTAPLPNRTTQNGITATYLN